MLEEPGYVNQIPAGEGIAYFDCGKEPDWSWAEYTIVVGDCNIGRHHADLTLSGGEEATSDIVETLLTIAESMEGESAEGTDYE